MLKQLFNLIRRCKQVRTSALLVFWAFAYRYLRFGVKILARSGTMIYGAKNISTGGLLKIGMAYVGFSHKYDRTLLNVRGKLVFNADYTVGAGCRFDIGEGAEARFGSGYANPNTTFIIMNRLSVGDETIISWGCEFLDNNFHSLSYPGSLSLSETGISIGRRVWIGSNVKVLPGARIPDGCVVAAGSVVSGHFTESNCLLGGVPARVIKKEVHWE